MGRMWTPERMNHARIACARWGGTPHRNRIAVPGQGIDCIRFVFEVLIASGAAPRFTLPAYNPNLGLLREVNIMGTLIADYMHAETLPADAPLTFGDLLIFQCGEVSNHMGIVIDGSVWHVPGKGRCGPAALSTITGLQCIIRITEPGFKSDPSSLTWEQILNRKHER